MDEKKQNCVTCKEKINAKALKCIHCDSYQDWRKYLNITNTSLTLIIALISVITLSLPTLSNFVISKKENITAQIIGNSGNRLLILLTNEGGKTGAIESEGSIILLSKSKSPFPIYLDENISSDSKNADRLLLKSGESRILLARTNGGAPTSNGVTDKSCNLVLVIRSHAVKRLLKQKFSCAISGK